MTATGEPDLRTSLNRLRQQADDANNALDAGMTEAAQAAIQTIQTGLSEAERNAGRNGGVRVDETRTNGAQPIPSNNLEAEEACLGAMMLAPAAVKAVTAEIGADAFYRESHSIIFRAILEISEAGGAVDAITVAAHLEQNGQVDQVQAGVPGGPVGRGRVYELAALVPTTSNVGHYARIVRRCSLERALARAVATAPPDTEQISQAAAALTRETVGGVRRAIDGATWLRSQPKGCPAVWGTGDQVLWAEGEPVMIYGPDGVGKTSLAQQIVLHLCGVRLEALLDLPVARADSPVLYLACDRPRQARRSLYRMIPREKHDLLESRLLVWEGPLPFVIPKNTRALLDFCVMHEARYVVIDSLKDVAVQLTDPETALKVNQSFQWLMANGVELLVLHHPRKDPAGMPAKPKELEDVYGDRNFVGGMGSVIALWGKGGDPIVELTHLKQPMAQFGPMKILHDHEHGISVPYEFSSVLDIIGASMRPLTIAEIASQFFASVQPSSAERQKIRYQLRKMLEHGDVLEFKDSNGDGGVAYGVR